MCLLLTRESVASNGSSTARRVLSPSTGFITDVFLDVLVGLGSAYTSSKIPAGIFFKFQRSDYPRAG